MTALWTLKVFGPQIMVRSEHSLDLNKLWRPCISSVVGSSIVVSALLRRDYEEVGGA